jgi:small subunit ribosomal protein SAe
LDAQWCEQKCSVQVDLFFYRDPEEAKEQEEEAAAAPEFAAITDYPSGDQWGASEQWPTDAVAPPATVAAGADWGAAPGLYLITSISSVNFIIFHT